MKRQLVAVALVISGCFTGCVGIPLIPLTPMGYLALKRGDYEAPSESSGIDPITQAGIDADNAATNDQSNQDIRDAAAAASAASANP